VDSERELHTPGGLTLLQKRIAGTDGQAGTKFTLAQLQGLMLGNDAYSGKIQRGGLVALCVANPIVTLPNATMVDISAACPTHGGINASGLFNIIRATFQGAAGDPNVSNGSSWIQAMELTEGGPVSRGILTYSLSPNPDSPHFADQTLLFSQKQWVDLPFSDEQVSAAALSPVEPSEGRAECKKDG
jgi:hypothetical protein